MQAGALTVGTSAYDTCTHNDAIILDGTQTFYRLFLLQVSLVTSVVATVPAVAPFGPVQLPLSVLLLTSNMTRGQSISFAAFISPSGHIGYRVVIHMIASFKHPHATIVPPCSVAVARINDTSAAVTAPSWPNAPGAALVCIASSVAAAVAISASSPASCSNFEFVARFDGACLTGRPADASSQLTISQPPLSSVILHVFGSGFNREWSGARCVLQCSGSGGTCSSFSAAQFQSSTSATCGLPPVCNNSNPCNLSLSFPSSSQPSDFPVAIIRMDSFEEDLTANRFSVNGCSGNCTALLSTFDGMLLLRFGFEVGGRSGSTWVQVFPQDTAVLEKSVPYPVEDMVPIRRGRVSHGSTLVSPCMHVTSMLLACVLTHSCSRYYFSSVHAVAAARSSRSFHSLHLLCL